MKSDPLSDVSRLLFKTATLFSQAQEVYDEFKSASQHFRKPPAPADDFAWESDLGVSRTATRDVMEAAWRAKIADLHPDKGGSGDVEAATKLNAARDAARRYYDAQEAR